MFLWSCKRPIPMVCWTKRNPPGIAISDHPFGSLPILRAGKRGTNSWFYRNAFWWWAMLWGWKVWTYFESTLAPNDDKTSLSLENTSLKIKTTILTWIKRIISSPSVPYMLRGRAEKLLKWPKGFLPGVKKEIFFPFQQRHLCISARHPCCMSFLFIFSVHQGILTTMCTSHNHWALVLN